MEPWRYEPAQDLELPLIDYMTELALEADSIGFGGVSLTEHHLHENQGYQNSLLFGCSLAPQLKQATLVLAGAPFPSKSATVVDTAGEASTS